ncbi:MAG: DUF2797 domain-containing protein [Halobacteriales archaeon]
MQVVGYDTGLDGLGFDPTAGIVGEPDEPALLLADDGWVRREPLAPDRELSYTLGRRHCAGELAGESHEACDAAEAPYCPDHADDWPCARCTGNCDKPIPACDAEHAVYLAAFAPDVLKVGVTRLARLPIRLREQGADRAAHLHTVSDGRIARRVERELAADVPDRVTVRTKIEGLAEPLDEAAWAAALDRYDVIDTFRFDYGLALAERPVAETLATGTVVGTKGRLLVLRRAAGTYAVDLRELVGHDLDPGPTDRELQASLGTFG